MFPLIKFMLDTLRVLRFVSGSVFAIFFHVIMKPVWVECFYSLTVLLYIAYMYVKFKEFRQGRKMLKGIYILKHTNII